MMIWVIGLLLYRKVRETGLVAKAGEDFKGRKVHPLFGNTLLLALRVDAVGYHGQISTMRGWTQ